ncbi:hypothetical protein MLD52_12705 [Puniceicoccaceae bacterium K14]|nr:hypothetical protein [Puniceicoccaceae bacterium K14]
MDKPISFYIKRNAKLVREFKQGTSIDDLCEEYALKKQRVKQILRHAGLSTMVTPDGPKSPGQIMKELGLTPYKVRGALIRSGATDRQLLTYKQDYDYFAEKQERVLKRKASKSTE